jgi:uncharacterized membrane protein
MSGESVEDRLAAIERRLAAIEDRLGTRFVPPAPVEPHARHAQPQAGEMWLQDVRTPMQPAVAAPERPGPGASGPGASRPAAPAPAPAHDAGSAVTSILGWGGALAFVLAAAYVIRLGIDSGWLTPVVQVAAAMAGGFVLIGAGFGLRGSWPRYAGYLPACGVVILFMAIYGAHLYYELIGARTAGFFVVGGCALSLWLCRAFDSDLYALFAVAGSYSAPFLLASAGGSITDLVVYYSAWSVVFSVYAIWRGRRLIYLLALYLALIGFDLIWHRVASGQWLAALAFQTVQFVIFGIATVWFSVRRGEAMDTFTAVMHLPALLLFYALQYYVLDRHLPAWAPWISFASLAAVGLLYWGARALLQRPLPGGAFLLWCYLALVLFHAGYLEALPQAWHPWAAVILVPFALWLGTKRGDGSPAPYALWVLAGLVFLLNFFRVLIDFRMDDVPGHAILPIAYAALLYGGYYLLSREGRFREIRLLLVYAGHVAMMAAAVQLLHVPIVQSTAWGLLALACLGISMWRNNRMLGQSSLLVFGATAAKVLLYDLSGAPPLARIISLVVLGLTFYVGGMLYQRLSAVRDAA